ncbi:class I SAM-dependent methyltransferase [Actinoallomurus bryophytorum]
MGALDDPEGRPMQTGRPSITALGVAAARAAHQEIEDGRVFSDPLAARILGPDAGDPAFETSFDAANEMARLVVTARARYAEEALAAAVSRGVRQVVILGAGLDTFAYRSPYGPAGPRVFEVDFPATQEWKRERLAAAGIAEPPSLTFAPIDFERSSLAGGLAEAGFDADRPAFFVWAGVVPYLTPQAVLGTLAFIAALPRGSGVVFDYLDPPDTLAPPFRAAHEARAAWTAANGEPLLSHFAAEDLVAQLRDLGFRDIENLDYHDVCTRYESGMATPPPGAGAHVIAATI